MNYPQTEDYTRVTEYKHLTGQVHPRTSLTYEYPSDHGDPYYPVPRPENEALYKRYQALADKCPNVWFVGRLATYRYYNMDQVVGQALATFARISAQLDGNATPAAGSSGGVAPPMAIPEPGDLRGERRVDRSRAACRRRSRAGRWGSAGRRPSRGSR